MKRREFIAFIGGAAAWSRGARAQQREHARLIGIIQPAAADDTVFQARVGAFLQELALLGWSIGRNLTVETRWATTNPAEILKQSKELLGLAPDALLVAGDSTVPPLLQLTRSVPIVFTVVVDPVGAGYVESLAHPGGNITGFMTYEFGMSGKWLEVLKEIAPAVMRVAVIRDASNPYYLAQFGAMQAVGPSLGLEVIPINMRDAGEIEKSVKAFASSPNGGLVVAASGTAIRYRDLIITLASQYKLPAAYFERFFTVAGGLISYGPDLIDNYRRAAGYIDRILKGEKPAELPVQVPTKFVTVINLKTAKSLGLAVPQPLIARADEVIE